MSKTLNEQIVRIKSLFTEERLYGNLINEDNGGNKLPGPNYYQIQKFLEEKTGFDTGAAGFGNKTAEALGIYIFGDNNKIKTVEELSEVLTTLGYDTKGSGFGVNYATAVSDIIKFVETKMLDLPSILNNNKEMVLNLVNNSMSNILPITKTIPLDSVLSSNPPKKVKGNGAATNHYKSFRRKDLTYTINEINLTFYDIEKGILNGSISGDIFIGNVYGGNIDTSFVGEITFKIDIIDDTYLNVKIESVNINTKYNYIDSTVDIGYQIKNNKFKLVLAANLNPLFPGYTKFGPYFYSTPIEKEIKKIEIPPINLKNYMGKFRNDIIKKL
jgi:hypothetical protein